MIANKQCAAAHRHVFSSQNFDPINSVRESPKNKPREGVRLLEAYEAQLQSKTYLNIERGKKKPKRK